MERLSNKNRKENLKNIFQAIISTVVIVLIAITFTACSSTAPTTTAAKITTTQIPTTTTSGSTTTVEQTTTTTTEANKAVEYQGVIIQPVTGLRFDNGIFFAEAGNPYGLEAETKAGVFIKDAVEVNEKMESAIGLRPEVIEVMQKEIMEKDKEFRYPLPFDFEKAKGIKLIEKETSPDSDFSKTSWDKAKILVISNIPLGAKIYSPVSTYRVDILDQSKIDDWFAFFFDAKDPTNNSQNNQYSVDYQGNRVDEIWISFNIIGAEIIPPDLIGKFSKVPVRALKMGSKIGDPLVKITEEKFIDPKRAGLGENDKFSMFISLRMVQTNNKYTIDEYKVVGGVNPGLSAGFLNLKTNDNDCLVSLLSNE